MHKYRILPMGQSDRGLTAIPIPDPRPEPVPTPRIETDPKPLRVPMFDIGDLTTPVKPRKKDKPS